MPQDRTSTTLAEQSRPERTTNCPYCGEVINAQAKKCKHCHEILDPALRELEFLKSQKPASQVFMTGGGASSSSSASAAAASGPGYYLRRYPFWRHLILTLLTGGLWLPIWILLYVFRNKRYYA